MSYIYRADLCPPTAVNIIFTSLRSAYSLCSAAKSLFLLYAVDFSMAFLCCWCFLQEYIPVLMLFCDVCRILIFIHLRTGLTSKREGFLPWSYDTQKSIENKTQRNLSVREERKQTKLQNNPQPTTHNEVRQRRRSWTESIPEAVRASCLRAPHTERATPPKKNKKNSMAYTKPFINIVFTSYTWLYHLANYALAYTDHERLSLLIIYSGVWTTV